MRALIALLLTVGAASAQGLRDGDTRMDASGMAEALSGQVVEFFDGSLARYGADGSYTYRYTPTDPEWIGTWEAQAGGLDTVIVSVGGGGLIGGVAAWFGKSARILAVESEGTPTYATALREGPQASIRPTGIAASSLGASTIGGRALAHVAVCVVSSGLVSDGVSRSAHRQRWEERRLDVEPGAATALAALT